LVVRVNSTTIEVSPDRDGLVAEQLPAAGTLVDPGSTVSITLGEAPTTTTTETTTTTAAP
jgi:beta-lactam-binding protein with PASTA domain